MKKLSSSILGLAGLLFLLPSLHAQALYTATRGARIQAGVGVMALNNDYTERSTNKGLTVWGDYDFNRFLGVEAEANFGGLVTPDDLGEDTYLIGPRVSYRKQRLNVFGKVMFGRGSIFYQPPIGNSSSSYNVYALGGGVEYQVTRHINIRAIDIELQKWPGFYPHTLSPIVYSAGVFYTIR